MFKKIIIIAICSVIAFTPCIYTFNYSFAEDNSSSDQNWLFIVDAEHDLQDTLIVSAFKAYLNANKTYMNFSYPYEKAIVNWTYDNINKLCKDAGLGTIEDYYDEIAVAVDNNGYFKFWYKAGGIELMDSLFKAYLQHYGILTDNEIKNIFDGEYFSDNQGHGCYITQVYTDNLSGNGFSYDNVNNFIIQFGTKYLYDESYFNDHELGTKNYTLEYGTSSLSYTITNSTEDRGRVTVDLSELGGNGMLYWNYSNNSIKTNYSMATVYKNVNPNSSKYNRYYLGTFIDYTDSSHHNFGYFMPYQITNKNSNFTDALIDIAKRGADNANLALANNAVLNVGQMGADIAVAAVNYLEDQTENDPEVETPDEPPEINPQVNIPVGIVNNLPITISLPNLNDLIPNSIPYIPNGFTIPGLRYKFPFCIPFDMIAVYELLDQTPKAPYFETEINFASFNYDLVIDLEDYNPYMIHIRNYFLILYIFGLLFITPKLLKA